MGEHSPTKNIQMPAALDKVPEKVSQGEALQHSAQTGVLPDALLPVNPGTDRFPFLVVEHDIQRHDADEDALEEAHDMHIPIDPSALVQVVVLLRDKVAREERRDDGADPCVQRERKEDLVYVEGECGQREQLGEGLGEVDKAGRRRHGEGVFHGRGLI